MSCGSGPVDEVEWGVEVVLSVEEVLVDEETLHEDRLGRTGPEEQDEEQGSGVPHWLYRKQTSP